MRLSLLLFSTLVFGGLAAGAEATQLPVHDGLSGLLTGEFFKDVDVVAYVEALFIASAFIVPTAIVVLMMSLLRLISRYGFRLVVVSFGLLACSALLAAHRYALV